MREGINCTLQVRYHCFTPEYTPQTNGITPLFHCRGRKKTFSRLLILHAPIKQSKNDKQITINHTKMKSSLTAFTCKSKNNPTTTTAYFGVSRGGGNTATAVHERAQQLLRHASAASLSHMSPQASFVFLPQAGFFLFSHLLASFGLRLPLNPCNCCLLFSSKLCLSPPCLRLFPRPHRRPCSHNTKCTGC